MDTPLALRCQLIAAMTKEERRTFYDAHFDAGTCGLCDRPIVPGDAIYTLTGTHWDCHDTVTGGTRRTLALLGSVSDRAAGEGCRFLARAAGGHLLHTVDDASGIALCGHRLTHTAKRMRRRSRWLRYDHVPAGFARCPKCDATAPMHVEACAERILPTDEPQIPTAGGKPERPASKKVA
jgi:hypothetical protein